MARLEGGALVIAGGLIVVALLFGWTRSAWFLVVPAAIAVDMVLAGLGRDSHLAKFVKLSAGWMEKTRQVS